MTVYAVCLGFNTLEMIRGALQNFEDTTTDEEKKITRKLLFDPGFPGVDKLELRRLAFQFGWSGPFEIENAGVMENHNVAIHDYCKMKDGDAYICYDPDVRIQERGWLSAALEILDSDPNTVFVCAARPFHNDDWCVKQHGRTISQLPSGVRVARYAHLIAWSTGVWKGAWLASRPRDFKASHPVYSWCEHADIALMQKHGKTWASLVDFYDHHLGSDANYTLWKQECAQNKTQARFEEWLKEKGQ